MKTILIIFLMCSVVYADDWVECLNGACTGEVELDALMSFDIAVEDHSSQTNVTWGISKTEFKPQKDITIYELALITKCFIEKSNYCGSPPKEVERHFSETIICTGPEECREMGY